MADFGSGRRRRFGRTRVIIGLSPVLLLAGFMLAEQVSAIGSGGPLFATSAVVVDDQAPVAVAGVPPADVARTAPAAPAAQAPAGDTPAQPAGEPEAQPAEAVPQPVLQITDLASVDPEDSGQPLLANIDPDPAGEKLAALGPGVLPDERRGDFAGWRVAPVPSVPAAEPGGLEPDATEALLPTAEGEESFKSLDEWEITVAQGTWNSPAPARRPEPIVETADRAATVPLSGSSGALPASREAAPQDVSPAAVADPVPESTAQGDEPRRDVPLAISEDGPLDRARVVIHEPGRGGAAGARNLLGSLQAHGVERTEIRSVGATVARPDIRYFHARDRAIAEQVRAALAAQGYSAQIKDFTGFASPPSRGTVEVWLPG